MAQTATVKKASTPRVGRVPKGAKTWDHAGAVRKRLNDLNDFLAFSDSYPDKSGWLFYVYRLLPKIDFNQIGGKERNILKTKDTADLRPAALVARFGVGKYSITLNDSNRPKGAKEVANTIFTLDEGPPPIYDIRALLLGHPDNIDEVNRQLNLGALVRDHQSGLPRLRTVADGAGGVDSNGAAAPPPPVGGSDAGLFDRSILSSVVGEAIKRSLQQQNPKEQLEQQITLAKMLMPAAAPSISVEDVVERVTARLAPVLQRPADSFGEAFATYERVEGFIAKFRGPVAAVAGSVAPGAADTSAVWAANLPGILSGARLFLNEARELFTTVRPPAAAGAPQTNGANRTMTLQEKIEEIAMLGFQRMNEGVRGYDFAVYVCHFHPAGRQAFDYLDQNGGSQGLMALIAMNPDANVRALIAEPGRRAQIESFLADFFSFDSSDGEAAPVAGVAPPPVA